MKILFNYKNISIIAAFIILFNVIPLFSQDDYRYSSTDKFQRYNNGWIISEINIKDAPAGSFITNIDVYFEIVHPIKKEFNIFLTNSNEEGIYLLNNFQSEGKDILETISNIPDFNGENVNQNWKLVIKVPYSIDNSKGKKVNDDNCIIKNWSIKIYYSSPNPVTLISPEDNFVLNDNIIQLRWNAVTNADSYWLQISRDKEFNNIIFDKNLGNNIGIDLSGFPKDGSKYYWRVKAGNRNGWAYWSSIRNYDVKNDGMVKSSSYYGAYYRSPSNGTNISGTTIDYKYEFETDVTANPVNVDFEIAIDNSFSANSIIWDCTFSDYLDPQYIWTLTYTYRTSGAYDNGLTYYWRVRAKTSSFYNSWSPVWRIINSPSAKPDVPYVNRPYNGENIGGDTVIIDWDLANRAYNYHFQLASDSSFNSDSIIMDENDTEYNKTGLIISGFEDDGTEYYWRVKAENSEGDSSWSSTRYFVNGPSAKPGEVELKTPNNKAKISATTIPFRWHRTDRANSYHLQISYNKNFTKLGFDMDIGNYYGVDISNFPDDGSTFYWRVKAGNGQKNNRKWGSWSEVRSFVNGDSISIQPPSNLKASPGPQSGKITLSWTASSDADLAYYRLYMGYSSGQYYAYRDKIPKDWNLGSVVFNLTNGVQYYFIVTAITNSGRESEPSNEASAIPAVIGDTQAPTTPGNLKITDPGNGEELNLQWNQSTDNEGVSHYLLYRLTGSSSVSQTNYDSGFPVYITQTTYTDYYLDSKNNYYYKVLAVDNSDNKSGLSNLAYGSPKDKIIPAQPTNVELDAGNYNIELSWTAPNQNTDGSWLTDLAGYNIYRSTTRGSYPTTPLNGSSLITGRWYTDYNLAENINYYYIIKAVDYAGNQSSSSNEVSGRLIVNNSPPNPPANLTLISKPAEIALSWNPNNEPDLAGYDVYRGTASGNYSTTPLNSYLLTSESFTDSDVDPTKTYYYVVRSVDRDNQVSSNSNEVSGIVGSGAFWIISPTSSNKITLDFATQTNPTAVVKYHLDSNYLDLFPSGAKIKFEVINSQNKTTVYFVWDANPRSSSGSFDPSFVWNGKDNNNKIVSQGDYDIKLSVYASNATTMIMSDTKQTAIFIKSTPPGYTSLGCDINLPDSHWIPNTDENIRINNIEIYGLNGTQKITPEENHRNIKILSPLDPNWSTNDSGNNNINRNKGTCEYRLYADISGTDYLVRFVRNAGATKSSNAYNIYYNSNYFDSNGRALESNNYQLKVDANRRLYFNAKGATSSTFKLKVISNTGTVRPGDDLLLRFTLADYESYITTQAAATDGDFMAVYDKKMLWRANLYIDDGGGDWNNDNLWNSADNEWNRYYRCTDNDYNNYSITGNQEILSSLSQGDGRQVVSINPSTWPIHNSNNRATNQDIQDAVIYCFLNSTSPFEFNYDMENQRRTIKRYYNDLINKWIAPTSYPSFWYTLANWNTTLAPNFDRRNNNQAVDEGQHVWENYRDRDLQNNVVKLPALNDHPLGNNGDNTDIVDFIYQNYPFHNTNGIGVDCGGLVYMSIMYNNNNYNHSENLGNGYRDWLDVDETSGPNGLANDVMPKGGEADNLWFISDDNQEQLNGSFTNINKIIPGDIIHYIDGAIYHVMIVQSVQYDQNSRSTSPNQITLIESVYGNNNQGNPFGNVINTRTIEYLRDHNKLWRVGRLKTQ